MILHYQVHTGRASRVLLIVPEALIHQWLVEMMRRFNLHFSLFDKERLERGQDLLEGYEDESELSREENTVNLLKASSLSYAVWTF